jgi:hypothetical protein
MRFLGRYLSLAFCFICAHLWSFDPSLEWKTLSSSHFDVHYDAKHRALAIKTANLAEQTHQTLTKKLSWQPKDKTQLVITDHTDLANGYASALPFNRSVLFIHPPTAGRMDFDSWLASLITHEYTHVLHLDKTAAAPKFIRNIIGRAWFLFPNAYQPSWSIEGLATYLETDHSRKLGRGQSSVFAMMMREELKSGFKSINEVNMASPSWPLNARYLYGYFFFEFIEQTYGKEKLDLYIENYSDNLFPYLLNTNANNVLGKDMTALWQAFENYLNKRLLNESLSSASNVSRLLPLTTNGFFKSDIGVSKEGDIYWVENDGYHQTRLNKKSVSGEVIELTELNALATIDVIENDKLLIAQPEVCDEYNIYYDLYVFDEKAESLSRLTHCSRYIEAVWDASNNTVLALKAESGVFQIDRLDNKGELFETVWQGSEGVTVSYLDLSEDGKTLAASLQRSPNTRANIELFSLQNKQWQVMHPVSAHQWYPRFIKPDTLSFSSDVSGRFNIYQINLTEKKVTSVSNVGSGVFNHIYQPASDQLIAIGYQSTGYDLFQLSGEGELDKNVVSRNSSVQSKSVQSKLTESHSIQNNNDQVSDKETNDTSEREQNFTINDYSPWATLSPKYWLPFVVGNENSLEIGAQISGMDALENHVYSLAGSVELEKRLPNLFFTYQFDHSIELHLQHYHDIVDDNDDSTSDLVEQNSELELGYHFPVTSFLSQWDFELAMSLDNYRSYLWLDDDLQFIRDSQDILAGFAVSYNSASQFLRSISINDGRSVRAVVATSDVFDSDFTGKKALLDWREYLQIYKEHTLAIRLTAASAERGARAFRLGGDFSDAFFMRAETLLEDKYPFRGYQENSPYLTGRHFRMMSTEWRFPIAHVERTWMAPPLGVEKISGKLFYEKARVFGRSEFIVNALGLGDLSDKTFDAYGAELITQFRLGYFLPLNVRLGYARGRDPVIGDTEYYMSFGTSF